MLGGASGGLSYDVAQSLLFHPILTYYHLSRPSNEQAPIRFTLGRFIWTVDRVGDFKRVKVRIGVN
jgi:hypothetical protein